MASIKKEIIVIFMAMIPVIELRGAIPMGIVLGFTPIKSLILSMIGNILIIPIILKLFIPIINYFEKTKLFKSTIGWVKNRTLRKTKNTIKKYSMLGLLMFVAIPIPTTGVWTGSLAAALLNMDYKKSVATMSMGVAISGLIVVLISKNII